MSRRTWLVALLLASVRTWRWRRAGGQADRSVSTALDDGDLGLEVGWGERAVIRISWNSTWPSRSQWCPSLRARNRLQTQPQTQSQYPGRNRSWS